MKKIDAQKTMPELPAAKRPGMYSIRTPEVPWMTDKMAKAIDAEAKKL